MIIRAFISNIINGNNTDKINIKFKEESTLSLEDKMKELKALCVYELSEDFETIFENADFSKDKKKKKGMRSPDFRFNTNIKYFNRTGEFTNILIYNKHAEFVIRNKVFEVIVKALETITDHELDVETKNLFIKFNELYEEMIDKTEIYNRILCLRFKEAEETE
jgi:hypothetical protein